MSFDLRQYIRRQMDWSARTFGPAKRTVGIINHITKELEEIRKEPHDIEEWVDVMILAMDGAWRAGANPEQITEILLRKQVKNFTREWPDWREVSEDSAIEHIRDQ